MSTPAALDGSELAQLPVFPLPGAVLFPGRTIALHFFEPRYRALARHCMEHGPRAMAVAHLVAGHEREYEGEPPIHDVAGVGRIVAHRANEDGTHDVLLACVARVRLRELQFVSPFRRAGAELLPDVAPSAAELARVALLLREGTLGRIDLELGDAPPGHVVDAVLDRLVRDPLARQRLLETLDVEQRLATLLQLSTGSGDDPARWRRAN